LTTFSSLYKVVDILHHLWHTICTGVSRPLMATDMLASTA